MTKNREDKCIPSKEEEGYQEQERRRAQEAEIFRWPALQGPASEKNWLEEEERKRNIKEKQLKDETEKKAKEEEEKKRFHQEQREKEVICKKAKELKRHQGHEEKEKKQLEEEKMKREGEKNSIE